MYALQLCQNARESWIKNQLATATVMQILGDLENEKIALENNEIFKNDEATRAYIENFALKVFKLADDDDRAGNGSKKTVLMYKSAITFIEILNIFGEIPEDFNVKVKHAKWRMVEIAKAMKEGREPRPVELQSPSMSTPNDQTLNNSNEQTYITSPVGSQVSPTIPTSINVHQSIRTSDFDEPLPEDYYTFIETKIDDRITNEAQKLAKYAVSALMFDDIPTAIKNLEDAIKILKPYDTK
ncbi:DUF605-domain-containing protein [Rozella allomycis CSF55]|uniref:DUF605-domain-containing protein n=1 Tax=Rozella allomycis (strain CSF55) TaxID=988480 RepID=A0A4V1IZ81_ROZAC|nr:DUF605-domain-containing protein [Rozella allomycis CSF55]